MGDSGRIPGAGVAPRPGFSGGVATGPSYSGGAWSGHRHRHHRHHHHHFGGFFPFGGTYASSYYGPSYYDDTYYYDEPVVAVAPGGDDVAYCRQKYRSYDVRTGTFLGFDGRRHPCP
jgi:hypothetical protein